MLFFPRDYIVTLVVCLLFVSILSAQSDLYHIKKSNISEFEYILRAGDACSGNIKKIQKWIKPNFKVSGKAVGTYSFPKDSLLNVYNLYTGDKLNLKNGEMFTYNATTSVIYLGMNMDDFMKTYGISSGLFSMDAIHSMANDRIVTNKVNDKTKWVIQGTKYTLFLGNVGSFNFNSKKLTSWSYKGRKCLFAKKDIDKLKLFAIHFPNDSNIIIKVSGIPNINPLYCATAFSNIETIEFLLQAGASIQIESSLTALYVAGEFGQISSAQFFLNQGLDINIVDELGRTALHAAAKYKKIKFAEYLLKHGAIVDKKDNNGLTPLMYAAQSANSDMVGFLIRNGAMINSTSANGATPLIYASKTNNYSTALELLKLGANKKLKDSNSKTAGDYAVSKVKDILNFDSSRRTADLSLGSSNFSSSGYSSSFSGGLGIGYNIHMTFKWYIQFKMSYFFAISSVKEDPFVYRSYTPEYELNFIEFAPAIKYVFDWGYSDRGGIYLISGAGFQYILAARLLNASEDISSKDVSKNTDKFLYAINTGIGFGNNTVFIELKHSYGLPAKIDDFNSSLNAIRVHVGFGF